jgi:hypothetical protein
MTAPGMTLSLPEQIEQIKRAVERQKQAEDNLRREQPLLRFWDAEWRLQHVGGVEVKAQFSWVSNDTGPGQVELPLDSPVAQWIHDHVGRLQRGEGRNVGITVDYCGARWSGIMDKYVVEQREDGDTVLIVDFMHDYEHLKWVSVWSNPWLPAAFQAPRAFVLAGPVDWCLKTALLANLTREHNPFVTWPDDPLDPAGWLQPWMDVSKWHMVVKPTSFIESMESGIVWGVLTSRWATWHDMAKTMLEDSELSVRCDRWLEGDPPPWEGAKLRNGCLVIDIVDKSGVYIGTSHGGTLADGLIRTVAEFSDDFVDSTVNLAEDTETPQDYFRIGHKYTDKVLPYVVFREGDTSPIQSSQWIYSPSKGIQVNVGGHSMPGVNETISASVQAVGDIVGNVVMIGGLGGSLDTMLKPIYEDTILAWQSVKSSERAQNSGWERLFEYFQQGAQQAYTIASTIVLRAGFWATKTTISWKVQVADGLPYLIGDRGKGHFFLDDRVGLVLKGDTTIHMDRARKLDLAWDETNPPEWAITIGDDRNLQDPAQRAFGKIETLVAGLRDLGVW